MNNATHSCNPGLLESIGSACMQQIILKIYTVIVSAAKVLGFLSTNNEKSYLDNVKLASKAQNSTQCKQIWF